MDDLRIDEIMRILPHRYPFLLVDRIIEIEREQRIVGIKNVTINEPFFRGHFPDLPVMPGVLTIECMAQVGAVLGLIDQSDLENTRVFFMGIDRARFRRPIVPGDQLRISMEVLRKKGAIWKMQGEVRVGDERAAEATLLCSISKAE